MYSFFKAELQAYSAAADLALVEYDTGDLRIAASLRATAGAGYATLQQYLSSPFYAQSLTLEHRVELQSALVRLGEGLKRLELPLRARPPATAREKTSLLAYLFWLARGCPIGSPEEDWFRAETAISRRSRRGATVRSESRSRAETAAMSSTAAWNASSLAREGL
jgi:hypothetical protein